MTDRENNEIEYDRRMRLVPESLIELGRTDPSVNAAIKMYCHGDSIKNIVPALISHLVAENNRLRTVLLAKMRAERTIIEIPTPPAEETHE